MKGLRYLLLLPLALLAATTASSQSATSNREEAFYKALLLMERGQYAEAIPIFESLALERKTDSLLWNLGIAASETHAKDKALSAWLEFRKLAPDDWRGLAKLIQAYQATGDLKTRDEQRAELLQLWEEGKNTFLPPNPSIVGNKSLKRIAVCSRLSTSVPRATTWSSIHSKFVLLPRKTSRSHSGAMRVLTRSCGRLESSNVMSGSIIWIIPAETA